MKRTLLLVMMCLASVTFAQEPSSDAVERFNALPEAKKQELREKLKAFKAMPPEERERIKGN